jgi:hypothetical protein
MLAIAQRANNLYMLPSGKAALNYTIIENNFTSIAFYQFLLLYFMSEE